MDLSLVRADGCCPTSEDSSGIRVFASKDAPAQTDVLDVLRSGIDADDLVAPAVVLPDFHHKSTMEMPSSIVVATRESIRPTLTSASVNCGMALVAFDAEAPTPQGIAEFYRRVRERYPWPTTYRRELKVSEVMKAAVDGSRFACERYDVPVEDLERIEEFGRIDVEHLGGPDGVRRELPSLMAFLAGMRFGTVGPSNHFIELQNVEEVYDLPAAATLGLAKGQLTLQYHAGGGVLTGELGALFGRRQHRPQPLRAVAALTKPLHHLASARSRAEFAQRRNLYFSDGCPPIQRNSREGERVLLANAAAMNYGFAFRTATYSALRQIAADVFGAASRLVVDSPHNSIYEETVDGENAIVHRHNSCRAFPADRMTPGTAFGEVGQAILLPGTNRTSSYVCVPGPLAADGLNSACHGAGTIIDSFAERGLSGLDPQRRNTLRFSYSDAAPKVVEHLDDKGVDEALGILTGYGLVRPVARLRPMAVLT